MLVWLLVFGCLTYGSLFLLASIATLDYIVIYIVMMPTNHDYQYYSIVVQYYYTITTCCSSSSSSPLVCSRMALSVWHLSCNAGRMTCGAWRVSADAWRVTCDVTYNFRYACNVRRATCGVYRATCCSRRESCGIWCYDVRRWGLIHSNSTVPYQYYTLLILFFLNTTPIHTTFHFLINSIPYQYYTYPYYILWLYTW